MRVCQRPGSSSKGGDLGVLKAGSSRLGRKVEYTLPFPVLDPRSSTCQIYPPVSSPLPHQMWAPHSRLRATKWQAEASR